MLNSFPYADQWLGDWAMYEPAFNGLAGLVRSADLAKHLASIRAKPITPRREFDRQGAVAVIPLVGTLMKAEPSITSGTSTVVARQQVREAVASDGIGAILLHIDSPGGTVAGTHSLADEVARARMVKPVYAYIEDLAASAAYWVASQATRVFAGPTAIVGSIGTYGVAVDSSRAAEMEGVKVHVVRAGYHKGVGEPGTEITSDQLQEMQRRIDALNEHFIAGVASGRGMAPMRARNLADGRVYVGQHAVTVGLVDVIGSPADVLKALSETQPVVRINALAAIAAREKAAAATEETKSSYVPRSQR